MDTLQAILSRRSIRKYTQQAPSAETIHTLLEAAMAAPSANNPSPGTSWWSPTAAVLAALAAVLPYGQMLKQAPLAIAVCAEVISDERYWVQDCAAAAENILIAAHSPGAGRRVAGHLPARGARGRRGPGAGPAGGRLAAVRALPGLPGRAAVGAQPI